MRARALTWALWLGPAVLLALLLGVGYAAVWVAAAAGGFFYAALIMVLARRRMEEQMAQEAMANTEEHLRAVAEVDPEPARAFWRSLGRTDEEFDQLVNRSRGEGDGGAGL